MQTTIRTRSVKDSNDVKNLVDTQWIFQDFHNFSAILCIRQAKIQLIWFYVAEIRPTWADFLQPAHQQGLQYTSASLTNKITHVPDTQRQIIWHIL